MNSLPTFDLGLSNIFNDDDEIDQILLNVDDTFDSKTKQHTSAPDVRTIPKDLLMSSQEERELLLPLGKNAKRKADVNDDQVSSKVPKDDKQELLKFVQNNRNVNTAKKTNREVARFEKFLHERGENRVLNAIPPQELDVHLGHYIMSLQQENGQAYEPDSISSYIR